MMRKRLAQLLVALMIVAGGFVAWHRWGSPPAFTNGSGSGPAKVVAASGSVPVTIGNVRKADFPMNLGGLGQVQAFNTVTLRSRVDGQIEQIFFKEGQMVEQNDLLVQIDPAPYKAALDQANAKLAQDQANLQNANLDLQRYTTLAKQSFASAQQLDTQQALVRQLSALVQADEAAIASAQVQLDYTQIHAPIAGRVGFRLVDLGNIVHATDPNGILSITQIQPISVVFTAPGDEVDRINKAMQAGPVKVTALSADGQRTLGTGVLTVVSNQIDTTTATIQLKATFDNQDNALWPGLSVQTGMLIATLKDVLVVPTDAVQHGQNGLYAFVVTKDGKAAMRPIEVSETAAALSVVTKGLADGDRVVTAGQYRLEDGTPITFDAIAQNGAAQGQAP
jgi:multidrug efflux system membrane fusion protein